MAENGAGRVVRLQPETTRERAEALEERVRKLMIEDLAITARRVEAEYHYRTRVAVFAAVLAVVSFLCGLVAGALMLAFAETLLASL